MLVTIRDRNGLIDVVGIDRRTDLPDVAEGDVELGSKANYNFIIITHKGD